jgi:hypothetical protein
VGVEKMAKKECPCRELADEFFDHCQAGSDPTSREARDWMEQFRKENPVVRRAKPKNGIDWCCHICGKIVYCER